MLSSGDFGMAYTGRECSDIEANLVKIVNTQLRRKDSFSFMIIVAFRKQTLFTSIYSILNSKFCQSPGIY